MFKTNSQPDVGVHASRDKGGFYVEGLLINSSRTRARTLRVKVSPTHVITIIIIIIIIIILYLSAITPASGSSGFFDWNRAACFLSSWLQALQAPLYSGSPGWIFLMSIPIRYFLTISIFLAYK